MFAEAGIVRKNLYSASYDVTMAKSFLLNRQKMNEYGINMNHSLLYSIYSMYTVVQCIYIVDKYNKYNTSP